MRGIEQSVAARSAGAKTATYQAVFTDDKKRPLAIFRKIAPAREDLHGNIARKFVAPVFPDAHGRLYSCHFYLETRVESAAVLVDFLA
jgi:hypothetical protein